MAGPRDRLPPTVPSNRPSPRASVSGPSAPEPAQVMRCTPRCVGPASRTLSIEGRSPWAGPRPSVSASPPSHASFIFLARALKLRARHRARWTLQRTSTPARLGPQRPRRASPLEALRRTQASAQWPPVPRRSHATVCPGPTGPERRGEFKPPRYRTSNLSGPKAAEMASLPDQQIRLIQCHPRAGSVGMRPKAANQTKFSAEGSTAGKHRRAIAARNMPAVRRPRRPVTPVGAVSGGSPPG